MVTSVIKYFLFLCAAKIAIAVPAWASFGDTEGDLSDDGHRNVEHKKKSHVRVEQM